MRIAAVTLVLVVATAARSAAQPYAVTELPCLPNTFRAFVSDINDQQEVAGSCDDEVVVWNGAGVHPIGLRGAVPVDINNRGVVSGRRTVSGEPQLFEWTSGVFRRLPQPPGALLFFRGRTENDILLVGTDLATWAVLGNAVYNLSSLTGGAVSSVNELGTIGGSLNGTPFLRLLDGTIIRPLPGVFGTILAIGRNGHFAGVGGGAFSQSFFVGAPNGSAAPVPMIPTRFADVSSINGRGDFVGSTAFNAGLPSAVVYSNGQLIGLDTALDAPYTIVSANAINDRGQIGATGRLIGGGPIVALLLTPRVPFAPQDFAFAVAGRTVTLRWQPAVGAIDYILEAGTSPGLANVFSGSVGAAPGLSVAAPPGRYYARVRARNAIGTSAPSNEIVVDVF